jgi:protein-S-isoprenylcysteine O-methyltransferase Ste14
MSNALPSAPLRAPASTGRIVARWLLRTVLGAIILAAILFLAFGSIAWLGAWLYIGGMIAAGVTAAAVSDSGLLAERMTRRHVDQKPWDRVLFGLYGFMTALAVPLVAGLDRRYAWAEALPEGWAWVAMLVFAFGWLIDLWAMAANKYFAEVVRLQRDRGQTVITQGPYRYVRHPGYLGGAIFLLACPFVLGSWWSLIPSVLGAALLVLRTALEDRVLQAELPGYADYASRVHYRLLPGVW